MVIKAKSEKVYIITILSLINCFYDDIFHLIDIILIYNVKNVLSHTFDHFLSVYNRDIIY